MRLSLFLVIICSVSISFAFTEPSDSTKPKKKKIPGIMWHFSGLNAPERDYVHKYDRLYLDLTYCGWYGERTTPTNVNIGFNVAFMFDMPIKKAPIGFGLGIGFSEYLVRHKGYFQSTEGDNGYTQLQNLPDTVSRKNNRFVAQYLEVPFEFRIRTRKETMFKIFLGFKAGVRVNQFYGYKDDSGKYKEFNFYDMPRFRYGPTFRIGVNNFMLYGAWFLDDLFTSEQSTKLRPFTLGITFSLF